MLLRIWIKIGMKKGQGKQLNPREQQLGIYLDLDSNL